VENRFNLVDEPWIPVVDVGLVSLNAVFSQPEYRALGGNPVQKIASAIAGQKMDRAVFNCIAY